MDASEIRTGIRIKTTKKLNSADGWCVHLNNISTRKNNTEGAILYCVPGHGGDVWFIKHDDNTVAAYDTFEFNPI